jgi:hypothetical protein
VADEAGKEGAGFPRGPKGARKHKPGRGHDRKSQRKHKARIAKRLKEKHRKRKELRRRQEEAHANLPPEKRKLLKPEDIDIPEGEL